jgi:hypothetical protein
LFVFVIFGWGDIIRINPQPCLNKIIIIFYEETIFNIDISCDDIHTESPAQNPPDAGNQPENL